MNPLNPFLNSKVIVSTGTGGVGKTTVSAALGVFFAHQGKKVLVLTIDPAKRLAQALGLKDSVYEPTKVEAVEGEMYASMIDPKRIFDRFVERFSPGEEVTQRLKSNRLYQQLVTALTGSQEFTSMDRLLSEAETGLYDVIILDTPPTQNAVDFLKAPSRIVNLFDEGITRWFIQGAKDLGFFSKILSKGTQTAMAALEKATGSEFIKELADFFQQMSHLQQSVRERSRRVETLLKSPETHFLIVSSADEQKIEETKIFAQALREGGFHLKSLFINRAYPLWVELDGPDSGVPFYEEAKTYYLEQLKKIDEFESQGKFSSVFKIPETDMTSSGLEDIVRLASVLEGL